MRSTDDIRSTIDSIIPADADCRDDDYPTFLDDLTATYIRFYANRPINLDLLDTIYTDIAR